MTEQLIGNYRVLKKIGAGGTAKVYLGVHREVPSLRVILKILSDQRLADRFRQEAEKLAVLDGHPSICRIKDYFTHGDDTVIAMEFIDGESLDQRLKAEGRIPVTEALNITAEVLDILSFAHERGICHRDIKPSNVMIDKTGRVKIIDFGIAKGENDPDLTTAGAICGTPTYMAPEQFSCTGDTDFALVDIYAAGTMLFRMLTGELPFTGENEFVLRDAKLSSDPPRPRSLNPGISKELEKIVLKAIDRDPARRYQSTSEMRQAILKVIANDTTADESTRANHVMVSEVRRRRPVVPVVIGVVVVVVAALAVYLALSPGGESELPKPVTLYAPADGALFAAGDRFALSWEGTAGPGGTYTLELAEDSLFTAPEIIPDVEFPRYSFEETPEGGRYFWRVTPVSRNGVHGEASGHFSFTIAAVSEQDSIENGVAATVVSDKSPRPSQLVTQPAERQQNVPSPSAKDPLGRIRVGSRPAGAKVYIDGELQRFRTINTFEVRPGRREVKVVLERGGEEIEQVDTVRVFSDSISKKIFDFGP